MKNGFAIVAAIGSLIAFVPSCRSSASHELSPEAATLRETAADNLRDLLAYMTGSFSSAKQAAADPDNYRDIRLHMTPIWRDREDGPWLYVEQAAATALNAPYRQRIYRLSAAADGTLLSDVYTLPGDALTYAGGWSTPERFAGLTPADLTLREGCSLLLRRAGESFNGATSGTGCASDLRGASYATSEAMIYADRLVTWDRGFDAAGKQVWGATAGGYEFRRE